jgi:hypothetical protein
VVKNSQKPYRFFTNFFTERGWDGWIWLDWLGLAWTGLDWQGKDSHRLYRFFAVSPEHGKITVKWRYLPLVGVSSSVSSV